MQPFEFTSPKTKEQVPALLGNNWGEVEILAGGTDLLSLMKDEITTPRRPPTPGRSSGGTGS